MFALRTLAVSSFVLGLLAVTGCDQASDCNAVCERYQSCFDEDYDVESCRDRCNERADDEEFRARTNECDACINERDCVDSAFSCSSECIDVIDE